jgi:hypothetical protein
VLLLAAALLVAAAPQSKVPASAHCPQAPYTAPQVAGPVPAGLTCTALEVSGNADRTNPSLDPAYVVSIAPSRFPAVAPSVPEGALQGLDAQGRLLFNQTMTAGGDFHTFVPVSEATARAIVKIRLIVGNASVDRSSSMHGAPTVELISVDDAHVVVAWSANLFPQIRVREYPNGPIIATGNGETSYTEITVPTGSSSLFIDFSDGVHSYTRVVRVWGR